MPRRALLGVFPVAVPDGVVRTEEDVEPRGAGTATGTAVTVATAVPVASAATAGATPGHAARSRGLDDTTGAVGHGRAPRVAAAGSTKSYLVASDLTLEKTLTPEAASVLQVTDSSASI